MTLISTQLSGQTPTGGQTAHGVTGAGIARPLLVADDGTLQTAVSGAGSGGTSSVDESTYTPASSAGTAVMVARDDTGTDTLAEDKVGIVRGTEYRAMHTNLRTSGGVEITNTGGALDVNIASGSSSGTEYTEDAAAAANPTGTAQILVRQDTPATLTTTDGDNVTQRGTNYGAAYTQILTSTGSFIDSFGGGTQYTEGDVDASITGTASLMEGAGNTLLPIQGTIADGLLMNLGANNDVTVTSSALPSGASTAANQTTIIGHVDGIEGLLTTIDADTGNIATSVASIDTKTPALGQALAAASTPVVLTAAQITTLTPPAAITGFATETTLSSLNSKVTAVNTGAVVVSSSALPSGASTSALQTTGNTSLSTIAGAVSGSEMQVDIVTMPTVVVDFEGDTTDLDSGAGTDNHAVIAIGLPASGGHVVGGTSTNPLRTDPTGTTTQPVSAASLPLPSGASTSALQTTGNTSLSSIDTKLPSNLTVTSTRLLTDGSGVTQPVSYATTGSGTATGAIRVELPTNGTGVIASVGTLTNALPTGTNTIGSVKLTDGSDTATITNMMAGAVQALDIAVRTSTGSHFGDFSTETTTASIKTSVELIDDTVHTSNATMGKGLLMFGNNSTIVKPIQTDSSGNIIVGSVSSALPSGTNILGKVGIDQTTVGTTNAVSVAQLGANTVSTGNGASGTGVLRVAQVNDGTGVLATVSTVSTLTGGAIAHDGVDSGNPIKVGSRAITLTSTATLVSSADRTDSIADLDGATIVRSGVPLGDLLSEAVSNTDGASTAFTNFGATTGTKNYVTSYNIFRTDTGTTMIYVDFRDGAAGSVLYRVPVPPTGGANSPCVGGSALFKTTANTALAYDVSAATTTVFISISGFKSKIS